MTQELITPSNFKFCPQCATPLAWVSAQEDGGAKSRWRCTACSFVHWNNPTPVLAAVVQVGNQILLARNAAWTGKFFALITGFMEEGESPMDGIAREVKEETNLDATGINLIGAYDFKRMNQVIIAYHVKASGDIQLSPELLEYRLFDFADLKCWRAGTGFALADWLTSQGYTPQFVDIPKR